MNKTARLGQKRLRKSAAALTAASAIAGGTQAYAVPIRFDNPDVGQPGHFDWLDYHAGNQTALDIMLPAELQHTSTSPRFFWFHEIDTFDYGCSSIPPGGECSGVSLEHLLFGGTHPQFARITETEYFNAGQIIAAPSATIEFRQLKKHVEFLSCTYSVPPTPFQPGCDFATQGNIDFQYTQEVVPDGAASPFYLGVRLLQGLETRYGWIGVRRENYSLTTFAWGYETAPFTSIAAGAVPEPGSLALLAFGVTAIASRRRKN